MTTSPDLIAPPHAMPSARRVAALVDTSTSWGRRILTGVNNYVRRHESWHLFVEARGMEERLRVPPGWRGDGVIARVAHPLMAAELAALGIPVVNVSSIQLPGAQFPCVTSDIKALGRLAVGHFLDRGFRHFGYFGLRGLSYVAAQQAAFVAALEKAGFGCEIYSVKPRTGAEPDWDLDLADLAAWLERLPKPAGVLAWNASSGRELIYACQLCGLKTPEEIAVLSGADDDILCEMSPVPMSGIAAAAEQIGHAAAALLDRLMRGGSAPRQPKKIAPLGVAARQSTDTLAIGDPELVKALSYIRESAPRPIGVSDIARHAGLSRRVLERRFAQLLGRTPAEELRRVRIERARKLLIETDLPIPEISKASGFGSPEYLAFAFKSATGQSPLKYRKEIRSR